MIRVLGVDHLSIRVGNFKKSKNFYNKLLKILGFKSMGQFTGYAGWSNGKTRYWISEADEKGKKQGYRSENIGFHHYAFKLAKRNDVDKLFGFLKKEKVKIVDPPADYPDYGKGYYAVFFLDPDGLKLEGMYFPGP